MGLHEDLGQAMGCSQNGGSLDSARTQGLRRDKRSLGFRV